MQFKNVAVSYGKKNILRNVTFDLQSHRLTALVGKNGCGKSTLLKAVNREVAYFGEILLKGRPISEWSRKEQAKRIAFLPQMLPTPALTVEELVAMGRNPYLDLTGRLHETDREKIDAALRLTELSDWRNRSLATLSGGERQRAFLAMILAQDTEILLLDEPTTYMDMGAASEFLRLLRNLAERHGKTILAVLHDLNAATAYADTVLLLDDGILTDSSRIEAVFGVEKCILADGTVFYR